MELPKIWTPAEYSGPTQFVHLHNHTVFSRLDGVSTPEQYAEECKLRGYPAMSATEHGNMASVPDMYTAFKKYGIKYIPGYEGYYSEHHAELKYRQADPQFHGDPKLKKECSARFCNASNNPIDWKMYLRLWRSRHLTLLAKNQEGFTNLIKLSTDVHSFGYDAQRGRARFSLEQLKQYKNGLIVLSGCLNGPISHALKQRDAEMVIEVRNKKERRRIREWGELLGATKAEDAYWRHRDKDGHTNEFRIHRVGTCNYDRARRIALEFQEVFGDDFYIELQTPVVKDTDEGSIFNRDYYGLLDLLPFTQSVRLANELGIGITFANDVHYLRKEDHRLQRLMMAIDQKVEVNSPDLFASNSSEQYMKTRAELWCTFKNYQYHQPVGYPNDPSSVYQVTEADFERACNTTLEIAAKCDNFKPDTSPKTPAWYEPPDEALRLAVYKALADTKFGDDPTKFIIDGKSVTYREQTEIELERFISKGFSPYFLITADLVRHGREQGYPFAPRGSAGGSLVCMLLGIHTLNPMLWGLSFDRFMSPSRGGYMLNISMPEPIN